jgi:hypothetical protein
MYCIELSTVIARSLCDEAIQSSLVALDCFAALAMTTERYRVFSSCCAVSTPGVRAILASSQPSQ